MSKHEHGSGVKVINQHGPLGFVFFTAFIGAAVFLYSSQRASGGS